MVHYTIRRILLVAAALMAMQVQAYNDDHIKVTLLSENTALQPGVTNWLGVLFEPKDHWHIYWQNPGDSGLAPKISLTLPDGVVAGDIYWPAPEFIPAAGLMNYGYHRTLLMIPVTVDQSVQVGEQLSVAAKVSWLVCHEECIPGRATLQLTLPVAGVGAVASVNAKEFQIARQRLPASTPLVGKYQVVDDRLTLVIPVSEAGLSNDNVLSDNIRFFPVTPDMVVYDQLPVIAVSDEQITATFFLSPYATDASQLFEFVIVVGNKTIIQGSATAEQ